jgi:hypothetical protein
MLMRWRLGKVKNACAERGIRDKSYCCADVNLPAPFLADSASMGSDEKSTIYCVTATICCAGGAAIPDSFGASANTSEIKQLH